MKKIAAGILSCVLALCSCASSKNADEYETSSESVAARNQSLSTKENYSDEKVLGDNKKKSFMEQLLGTGKFEKMQELQITLKTMFGNTFVRNGNAIYKPNTDMAGFYVLYDTSSYAFYLAKAERNAYIRAVDQYFEDFEAKKLDKKAKKSDRVYGSVVAYEEFGMSSFMLSNRSKPTAHFGYRFVGKFPYFCITVPVADNLSKDKGENHPDKVIEQRYYFTKAQARALADFLSDDSIDPLYVPYESESKEADDYQESEESAEIEKDAY